MDEPSEEDPAPTIARLKAQLAKVQLELETSQEHLERAQRLGTVGLLAGGIAHDINNYLSVIVGITTLAHETAKPGSPLDPTLAKVLSAARNASDLSKQMQGYAGESGTERAPLSLNEVVEEARALLDTLAKAKVVATYSLAEGLPTVHARAVQIRQVVMNIVINAAESIDLAGTIEVATGVTESAPTDELADGHYVFVRVADTGCGIGDTTKVQLFNPFFSRKLEGRGLGMGIVKRVLSEHNGAILIESDKGVGTTVGIYLPSDGVVPLETSEDDTTKLRF
jgi:two-component system, cell cycle sensor histidine kinase and response regulator CckA